MKTVETFKLVGLSMLVALGIAACDKPGPAETAGKKIDQTASDAGKKIGEAADKVGEKVSEESAKTGVAIDDTEITAKVKAAIFAEPGLKTLQISVDTVKGVVTLTGSVDSKANSDRANGLAGAVSGVKSVNNQLVQQSPK
jgi:osmotically-inducible protein OsmY